MREKQREALESIISGGFSTDSSPTRSHWKVLVFDEYCSQLYTLHFVVRDMRRCGVTMMLFVTPNGHI